MHEVQSPAPGEGRGRQQVHPRARGPDKGYWSIKLHLRERPLSHTRRRRDTDRHSTATLHLQGAHTGKCTHKSARVCMHTNMHTRGKTHTERFLSTSLLKSVFQDIFKLFYHQIFITCPIIYFKKVNVLFCHIIKKYLLSQSTRSTGSTSH